MKRAFTLATVVVLMNLMAPDAIAGPLASVIADHDAYVQAYDPTEKARARGQSVTIWADVRPEILAARADRAHALLARVSALAAPTDPDAAILKRLLMADMDAARFDEARIPFTGDWGFQADPVFAALETRVLTADEAQAWIARLEDLPRNFDQHKANMRRGIASGWTAHSDPLNTVIEQIRAQIKDDPRASDFFAPLKSLPADIDPITRARIETRGTEAVRGAVQSYRDMLVFLETEYAPRARADAGIANLTGGRETYARLVDLHTAGAGYSPEDIHAIGLQEVARIRAEMDGVIRQTGFKGSFADFQIFLRTDPQFYATTPDDLMTRARETSRKLDAILPLYFGKLPKLGYRVEPVPASIAPGYTSGRYVQGDPTSNRPGTYLVNTFALQERPLYELIALSAHEAVPGHHLQIALGQEVTAAPRFRRDYYATAYGEGWGLYAERLAGEAGLYVSPYDKFGALSMEMWRACRLVADTGLHWYGWTRAQAETCFNDNTALAPLNIKNEVTRYIGWPGQAVAYKVGELKIRALRAEAEAVLGKRFDIRAFHDVVLGQGAVPLDVLEAQVRSWIATQTGRTRLAAPP